MSLGRPTQLNEEGIHVWRYIRQEVAVTPTKWQKELTVPLTVYRTKHYVPLECLLDTHTQKKNILRMSCLCDTRNKKIQQETELSCRRLPKAKEKRSKWIKM